MLEKSGNEALCTSIVCCLLPKSPTQFVAIAFIVAGIGTVLVGALAYNQIGQLAAVTTDGSIGIMATGGGLFIFGAVLGVFTCCHRFKQRRVENLPTTPIRRPLQQHGDPREEAAISGLSFQEATCSNKKEESDDDEDIAPIQRSYQPFHFQESPQPSKVHMTYDTLIMENKRKRTTVHIQGLIFGKKITSYSATPFKPQLEGAFAIEDVRLTPEERIAIAFKDFQEWDAVFVMVLDHRAYVVVLGENYYAEREEDEQLVTQRRIPNENNPCKVQPLYSHCKESEYIYIKKLEDNEQQHAIQISTLTKFGLLPCTPLHSHTYTVERKRTPEEKLAHQLKCAQAQQDAELDKRFSEETNVATLLDPKFKPETLKVETSEELYASVASCQGIRSKMEDAHAMNRIYFRNQEVYHQGFLYAICDGHGGSAIAVQIANHFHACLTANLEKQPEEPLSARSIADAITRASAEMYEKITAKQSSPDLGSTLSGFFLYRGTCYSFNIGDTRTIAVIEGKAFQLTEDARLDEPRTARSIIGHGGLIADWGNTHRVSSLEVSRRFGGPLKDEQTYTNRFVDWVSSKPKITEQEVHAGTKMVVACDGLWKVASTDQVGERVLAWQELDTGTIAQRLVIGAINEDCKDNTSVMVVDIDEKLLKASYTTLSEKMMQEIQGSQDVDATEEKGKEKEPASKEPEKTDKTSANLEKETDKKLTDSDTSKGKEKELSTSEIPEITLANLEKEKETDKLDRYELSFELTARNGEAGEAHLKGFILPNKEAPSSFNIEEFQQKLQESFKTIQGTYHDKINHVLVELKDNYERQSIEAAFLLIFDGRIHAVTLGKKIAFASYSKTDKELHYYSNFDRRKVTYKCFTPHFNVEDIFIVFEGMENEGFNDGTIKNALKKVILTGLTVEKAIDEANQRKQLLIDCIMLKISDLQPLLGNRRITSFEEERYAKNALTAEQKSRKQLEASKKAQQEETAKQFTFGTVKIDSFLEAKYNNTFTVEFDPTLCAGVAHCQGPRSQMEDTHVMAKIEFCNLGLRKQGFLYAICDGHNGNEAAEVVAEELAQVLKEQLEKNADQELTFEYLANAFTATCVELYQNVLKPKTLRGAGTTLVASFLYRGILYTFNVGDSRAILSMQEVTTQLSEDAKPDEIRFRQALEDHGADVHNESLSGIKYYARGRHGRAEKGYNLARHLAAKVEGDYLSPRTKITQIEVKEGAFGIIACDGQWDVATTNEAGTILREWVAAGTTDPSQLASNFVKGALNAGSKDNVSTMVVYFDQTLIDASFEEREV